MYRFETRKGEIAHLTSKDCQEVYAILTAIKILHPSRVCMCTPENPEPWTVIHDEDLVALHRRDDNKPVLLFVTKENA
jgi:histidinol-phosphate/aromatic aminotransferase/cobyric acid decarboxylase-like protein